MRKGKSLKIKKSGGKSKLAVNFQFSENMVNVEFL